MKYRVMDSSGDVKDFNTEAEARVLYLSKKTLVDKAKPVGDIVPFVHIHKCYHQEDGSSDRPCEIIEEYKKLNIAEVGL